MGEVHGLHPGAAAVGMKEKMGEGLGRCAPLRAEKEEKGTSRNALLRKLICFGKFILMDTHDKVIAVI